VAAFVREIAWHGAMNPHELDNPFWSALRSRHQAIALCSGEAARYPAAFAPFLGVANAQADVAAAIASLVAADESVYLLGVVPALPHGWVLDAFPPLAQMICTTPIPVVDGPAAIELGEAHRADVLALTARVYPHYFRPRTMELGRYFGIYQDGRLAAMIGERLGMDAYQEISAVCTHPDFNGRGYARRLLALLSNDNLARDRTPFLHVSHQNHRAESLYEQMGYGHRRDIGFWSLRRVPA
jgi:ribosomal protein S18 acetylase RimI-like enzyme